MAKPVGIRLHHPNLRSCVYTLVHFGRPYTQPFQCGLCLQVHMHKTYHLSLDAVGDVVVSETVFRMLEAVGLNELQAKREVLPEVQVLDFNNPHNPNVVSREEGRLIRRAS
jgi:hypothetical protein